MPDFPSREWAVEFCKKLNESENYRSAGKGWVWPILFIVRDLPEEKRTGLGGGTPGFVLDLENGQCKNVEWFDDASGADAPFKISASYNDWVEIIQGKVNPVMAIMRRKLKLEKGDMSAVLRYPSAALEMVRVAQRVGGIQL